MLCAKPLTEKNKWIISGMSALIFVLIASPFMFKITGYLFAFIGLETDKDGCPNSTGLFIHALVFAVLIRLAMIIPIDAK